MAMNMIFGAIREGVVSTPLATKTVTAGISSTGRGGGSDVVSVAKGLLGFGKTGAQKKKAPTDFWSLAISAQKTFDADKDGHLTDNEVEKALKRRDITADQKAALETLRGKQSTLEEASNDELGDENDGITQNDLKAARNSNSQDARLITEQFKMEKGLTTDSTRPNRNKPADLTSKIGTREYYTERYKDFRRRNPDKPAPAYYMYYGAKYFDRFQELKPDVQPETRAWIDKTARKLQEKIENRNTGASFAELERNSEEFKQFAYETHPDAYLEGGLNKVPLADLAKIPFVPDLEDLASVDGAAQAVETGAGYTKKALEGVWDDVKSWFD